jgi:hypothetical protein
VAISSDAFTYFIRPINIENLKCTMLIGAICIATPVLEIATSLTLLAMTYLSKTCASNVQSWYRDRSGGQGSGRPTVAFNGTINENLKFTEILRQGQERYIALGVKL